MWSGSIASIPQGWALCDGNNNTPDLTDRFIVGAGTSYSVDETGGENTVVLTTGQLPAHSHSVLLKTGASSGSLNIGATSFSHSTTSLQSTGTQGSNQAHENRPPYYALAFIMKV